MTIDSDMQPPQDEVQPPANGGESKIHDPHEITVDTTIHDERSDDFFERVVADLVADVEQVGLNPDSLLYLFFDPNNPTFEYHEDGDYTLVQPFRFSELMVLDFSATSLGDDVDPLIKELYSAAQNVEVLKDIDPDSLNEEDAHRLNSDPMVLAVPTDIWDEEDIIDRKGHVPFYENMEGQVQAVIRLSVAGSTMGGLTELR